MEKNINRLTVKNGKGDTPRNISKKFRENYKKIKWTKNTFIKNND